MKEEILDKIIELISTHDKEEDLGYCDTGEDMEYSCRSECASMAVRRVMRAYKDGELN